MLRPPPRLILFFKLLLTCLTICLGTTYSPLCKIAVCVLCPFGGFTIPPFSNGRYDPAIFPTTLPILSPSFLCLNRFPTNEPKPLTISEPNSEPKIPIYN